MIWFLFALLALITPAQAAVPTPAGPWTLILDEEFNAGSQSAPADYTHLNDGRITPLWNPASGDDQPPYNLFGGHYCYLQHGITLRGHEIDLAAVPTCWVSGSPYNGEGSRIASGQQHSGHGTYSCNPSGVISYNGVVYPGFCFGPISDCPGAHVAEIYEETLYDVPCSGGNLLDHAALWNPGDIAFPGQEFDVIQPLNQTQLAAELFNGSTTPNIGKPVTACGWHVFGMHWVGAPSPSLQFLVDGADAGTFTTNVPVNPAIVLLELLWDGTPATTTGTATAKAVYVHVFGKNTTYPAVTPQANYGGPGDTAGKTLGAP